MQWFHQYYRCPASTEKAGLKVCTGKQQNGIHSTRSPAYDYPVSLEEDSRCGDMTSYDTRHGMT